MQTGQTCNFEVDDLGNLEESNKNVYKNSYEKSKLVDQSKHSFKQTKPVSTPPSQPNELSSI